LISLLKNKYFIITNKNKIINFKKFFNFKKKKY